MSIGNVLWAIKQSQLKAGPWRTLLHLCDSANDEHNHSWLSIQTIAQKSGAARSAVIEHIAQLQAEGYIVPGDQRYTAHIAANKRPKVWLINRERGTRADLQHQYPLDAPGVRSPDVQIPDPSGSRGPDSDTPGVRIPDPNQELEPNHVPQVGLESPDPHARAAAAQSALERSQAARAAARSRIKDAQTKYAVTTGDPECPSPINRNSPKNSPKRESTSFAAPANSS